MGGSLFSMLNSTLPTSTCLRFIPVFKYRKVELWLILEEKCLLSLIKCYFSR